MLKAILIMFLVSTSTVFAATPDDARAVVDSWAAAQNAGDLEAYSAHYAPTFKGIKRTIDGGEKTLTLAKWKTDRKRMFRGTQKVAVEDVSVVAKGKGFVVTFVQRYKSGSYEDHGHKELVLAPDKTGKLKITREELRASIPGWETDTDRTIDATNLKSPITVRLRTEKVSPYGDYENLALMLTLRDANMTEIVREVGAITEKPGKAGKVAPSSGGNLFTITSGGLLFAIKRSGDAIVVTERSIEGPNAENGWGAGTDALMTIMLPAKAKVTATK